MNEQTNEKFPKEIAEALRGLHFSKNEKGAYVYASGSIANYVRMTVYPPRLMFSVVEDRYVYASYTEYERFSEPGYIECDWEHIEKGSVSLSDIVNYCAKKTGRKFNS